MIGILLGCLVLDQVTKIIAIHTLKFQGRHSYLWDTFRFEYTENTGAFLGMGSELPDFIRYGIFSVVVGIFLVLLVIYIFKAKIEKEQRIAYAFIASGGFSNLIDRVFRENGGVVDFMNVGIGELRTGIFNIADMAILFAVIYLLIISFKKESELKNEAS